MPTAPRCRDWRRERAALQSQLAEARKPKSFNLGERVMSWADEVGLGLRVVELTGKPMTAMRAFKRYGGYAAGVATGMFGFPQVFWEPNRQAIQDKTAHTVVIDLRRKLTHPAEQPTPEESR